MANILYCGDIHGRTNDLRGFISHCDRLFDKSGIESTIIQLGDFGFGFPDGSMERWIKKRASTNPSVPIYTCMGNHDNWDMLYSIRSEHGNPDVVELYPGSKCYYVHRGSMIDIHGISHLFFGGAESIDRSYRILGRDWWTGEQPSQIEFNDFFSAFNDGKPDTVVTHEAPLRVPLYKDGRSNSVTASGIEAVYKNSNHKPKRHYFGHHHLLKTWDIDGTRFYCGGLHGQNFERNTLTNKDMQLLCDAE